MTRTNTTPTKSKQVTLEFTVVKGQNTKFSSTTSERRMTAYTDGFASLNINFGR